MLQLMEKNFKEEVLDYNGKVIIDIWATWCGKCKMIKPVFESLESKYKDYKFCTLEADGNNNLIEQLQVSNLPMFIIYENGKVVKRGGSEVLQDIGE